MIRIGIICPSEIAFRRFLPALKGLVSFKFVGVAVADRSEWEGADNDSINTEREKAETFVKEYGGKVFGSYKSISESSEIDAIYLPLPPALHYKWAKYALLSGKHILVEKPFTTAFNDSKDLISIANSSGLAVHENYMFVFHNQLKAVDEIINNGEIGNVRIHRISFGFPQRVSGDFRYNKILGGGALLDCGGYTIKYASKLLGDMARIVYANSNYLEGFDVDMYGSAALVNDRGTTIQISFGMDNAYKCELEVWGVKGILKTERIFTAPAGIVPEVSIIIGNETETRKLPADDAFIKSIQKFHECIENDSVRKDNYYKITKQAELVDDFRQKAKIK